MKKIIVAAVWFFVACLLATPTSFSAGPTSQQSAESIERNILRDKKMAQKREGAIIDTFCNRGKEYFEKGQYDRASEEFGRALEIDPQNKTARRLIQQVKKQIKREAKAAALQEERLRKSKAPPEVVLLKQAKNSLKNERYDEAIKDLEAVLAMDPNNKEALKWLIMAGREQAREREKNIIEDTKVAALQRSAQEHAMMLEVERAYLPPTKPEREEIEVEELISPEEEEAAAARKRLVKEMKKKIVPAVSLAEADIRDVIRQLMALTGVTIIIDEKALQEAAGDEPLRLTFSTVNPMPLLDLLEIALKPTDLTYRVEPNYIWISTADRLEKEKMVTRTYRLKYGVRRIRKVELTDYGEGE